MPIAPIDQLPPGSAAAIRSGSTAARMPRAIHPIFMEEGDVDAARELVEQGDAELFLYPGDQHYFADPSLPSYDAEATRLVVQRVLGLLARVD